MHNLRERSGGRSAAAIVALLIGVLTVVGFVNPATAVAPPPAHAAADVPPVIRVGTEGVYPPFSFHDQEDGGKLTGYDIDVMDAVGKKLGVKIEYVEAPFDSLFTALTTKRIDMIANQVTLTPERQGRYDLSVPYVDTTVVLVTRKGDNSIKTLKDIKGKKAGESLTSSFGDIAKENGAIVSGVDDLSKAMSLLRDGRVDVVVNDKLAVRSYLASTGDDKVQVSGETPDKTQSVLVARQGSGYLPQVNKAIAELTADGTIKKAYDKYFTATPKKLSKWELVRENAWPMVKATLTKTIPLTAISFAIGLVIALFVALARMSTNPVLDWLARAYISVIRGTPLLVQLFIIFYAFPEFEVKIDPFPAAVIAFSLNVGGYAAEIIRSAIQSIPKGQWEAGSTVGMNYATTLRRVILPQAARTAVPPLSNTLISLVKDTSLASTILVVELVRQAQIVAAPTGEYMTLYGAAALYYWIVCLALSFLQSRTETRLNRFVAA